MKKIWGIGIVFIMNSLHATPSIPYLALRSQGVNAVRNIVGWEQLINRCTGSFTCKGDFYGVAALTIEYDQTFWDGRLAQTLFSDDVVSNKNCAQLQISGSRYADRGPNDWLADYFGLPTDFFSQIFFQPKISNVIADLNFYFGLDNLAKGLYFKIDAPIVHSSWNLRFQEKVIDQGTNNYSAGYFSDAVVPNDQLLTKATDFFTGNMMPKLTQADGSTISFIPLSAAKWAGNINGSCCSLKKTRLADLNFTLGYNFFCADDRYLGFNIQVSAPTGNKPCGTYFFEPTVGNGGHVEVGAGLIGHTSFWESECDDASLGIYFDATIAALI